MAGKVAFLDRVLAALRTRSSGRARRISRGRRRRGRAHLAGRGKRSTQLAPNERMGDAFYLAVHRLSPHNDAQRALKAQAATVMVDLAELRSLLQAQSIPSISKPLLIALVCWLVVIFFGFSVIAPPNATTTLALVASAFLGRLRGFPNPGAGPPS